MSVDRSLTQVAADCRSAIAEAKARGHSVEPHAPLEPAESASVCIIGAVAYGHLYQECASPYSEAAATRLGITVDQMRSIEFGFEERTPFKIDERYVELGRALREETGRYLPREVSRRLADAFDVLTAEERLEIYSELKTKFCPRCGNKHPSETRRCQCWNDE